MSNIEISVQEYKSLLRDKETLDLLVNSLADDIFDCKEYTFATMSERTKWLLRELMPQAMENLKERINEEMPFTENEK